MFKIPVPLFALVFLSACSGDKNPASKKGISREKFGLVDGQEVYLYTLSNHKGDYVKITNYGGIVTQWVCSDKNGKKSSVVLGFDSLKNYLAGTPFFGALIGRYGNRIAKARFSIGDSVYSLAANNGVNHLHGGIRGFDKVIWQPSEIIDTVPELILHYLSRDGEEGYPGNLDVRVTYSFSDDNALQIEYEASTDKPTVINLTQHSYFNLSGDPSIDILDHRLQIAADYYTPVDSMLIPTGELKPVIGTLFDFNLSGRIGAGIGKVPGGYDHNFVLRRRGPGLEKLAELSDPVSGRKLEIFTTEPGLQFYSGNFLDGSILSSRGKPFKKHAGLCLETQHFPDSPNQPAFPSTLLKPGEKYHTVTKYRLETGK